MPNMDGTGPRSGSKGPRDGRGQGKGRAGGSGIGKKKGGKKGNCWYGFLIERKWNKGGKINARTR